MMTKVIKKQVFVNLRLISTLLMLMLHITILRWPLRSPWCYLLEKALRREPGSAFHILRSLLTNELISHQAILEHLTITNIIINKPSWGLHNKQALLSNFQAWGSWPFVGSLCLSASPSLRVCCSSSAHSPAEKPALLFCPVLPWAASTSC